MKKEKKERFGFFKKLREYWKIPRYRSLIILGMYVFFFVAVFIYIYIMDSISSRVVTREPEKVDAVTSFASMDNYEYYYEIESAGIDEVSSYTISGIRYDNQDNFKIGMDSFYVQDNIIYSVDGSKDITSIIQIDLLALRPGHIYTLLQNSISTNRIEYQNGDAKVTYAIPVTMFNIAFLQFIPEGNTEVVEVVTYEKDNQIYQIDLNILNLMKIVDPTLESYFIKIVYENIDNIKKVEELSTK